MNFLIKIVGKGIARQIEKGSTKGAQIGAVVGAALLGGVAVAFWAAGVTGYMGAGLSLAGALVGGIMGALIGSNIGPKDRLIHTDGQACLRINDYNRKLVAAVPMVGCLAIAVTSFIVFSKQPPGDDKNALLLAGIICSLLSLISLVYLACQTIAVTLSDDIVVHRPFNRYTYAFSLVESFGINAAVGVSPPFPEGVDLMFCLGLPDRQVAIPISAGQANDLMAIFDLHADDAYIKSGVTRE